jgi:hypothetical protein
MPFKGDMRLGGPHDNEAHLNGTSSDFEGVPAAGTLISGPLQRDLSITIQQTGEVAGNGYQSYSILADGSGGQYESVNFTFYPTYGTRLGTIDWGNEVLYSSHNYDGTVTQYPNGKTSYLQAWADGNGNYSPESVTTGSFFGSGAMVTGAPFSVLNYEQYTISELGLSFNTGRYYGDTLYWTGDGEISISTGGAYVGGSYYPDGTFVADVADNNVEVPVFSNNYYHDGNDNRYEWNGNGVAVYRQSGLYGAGTFITNYDGTDYYWDGFGGYTT